MKLYCVQHQEIHPFINKRTKRTHWCRSKRAAFAKYHELARGARAVLNRKVYRFDLPKEINLAVLVATLNGEFDWKFTIIKDEDKEDL